ncbi:hypothetical protein PHAVU_001G120000 [Phaseolus vulgaris]|uniref:Myb/SANT-like domain-containing protein n=1 Tax=Phaseolus vulgaris TaxID=3885 RepID=V7CXN4_PHAVU|nr:hypothetical protein PHAVU_001G120000g [Phaseolus vulgaris]ESW34050.1 hypothetical protein PHAVU_001G120000g [Phaseolus vulgaris]
MEEQLAKFLHIIGHKIDRAKNVVAVSSGNLREFTKWIANMDLALLSSMGDNNIVMALHKVGMHTITKNHVKYRQKSLKNRWREVHDLFSSLSGFAWNQNSNKFEAEDEVWDSLIQAKASTSKWCVNSIRNYDLMEELWLNDRATGKGRTPRQETRHGPTENIPSNTQSTPSKATGGTSSSKGSKRKAPMATATQDVAADIRRRTDYYGEHVHHQRRITSYQYSKSDIWSLLVDMSISDENILDQCYDFLCENPAKVKQLFGLPAKRRMTKLFNMMTRRN